MSAFEDFIQIELPKRPYLNSDAPQESIMVRRGPGPRQLDSVALGEGQVLALVGGVVVGTTIASLGGSVRSAKLVVSVPAAIWTIAHALNSDNAIIQVVDGAGFVIQPDEIQIVNTSTITIKFTSPQAGTVRAIFID